MSLTVVPPADFWVSWFVRFRDKFECQSCHYIDQNLAFNLGEDSPGFPRRLECAHFFKRANKSTRWKPEACATLCHMCHGFFEVQPEFWRIFMIIRVGEEVYDELHRESLRPLPLAKSAEMAAAEYYKAQVIKMARERDMVWAIQKHLTNAELEEVLHGAAGH